MTTNYSSSIELSREALANNIKFIRSLIDEEVKISSVVKGNAYGHGIRQMIPELEKLDINHFSVFSSFEAKIAKKYTHKDSTIMIMGDISDEDLSWTVKNEIEFFAFNETGLNRMLEEGKKQNKKINIHIELETGMNRHGFEKEILDELIETLHENEKHFNLKGICTHFAGAESSANYKRILEQQRAFQEGVKKIKSNGLSPKRLHASCSAGIIAYPGFDLDMVRIGILQYGLWPSKESQLTYKLKHGNGNGLMDVLSWHSKIVEVKPVKAGEFIGYGNSYLAETDMTIASVPVGYGYGFSRALSNSGRVLVNGMRLSVVGMVNMNLFLIDVTNLDVEIGDKERNK